MILISISLKIDHRSGVKGPCPAFFSVFLQCEHIQTKHLQFSVAHAAAQIETHLGFMCHMRRGQGGKGIVRLRRIVTNNIIIAEYE